MLLWAPQALLPPRVVQIGAKNMESNVKEMSTRKQKAANPALAAELLREYGNVVDEEIRRKEATNSLSYNDITPFKREVFDLVASEYAHLRPYERRLGYVIRNATNVLLGGYQRREELSRHGSIRSNNQRLVIRVEDSLTPEFLHGELGPFLSALDAMQRVCNEIVGNERSEVVIRSITQKSPLEVNLDGAADVIRLLKEDIFPWRRKHAQKLARLQTKQLEAEIRQKEAEALEIQSRSDKLGAESLVVKATAERVAQETRKMMLENDKLEFEVNAAKLQLALRVVSKLQPNLPEAQRLAFAVKLLPSLNTLTTSKIDPLKIE